MKNLFFILIAAVSISLYAAKKPHIVLVMSDDHGWGDTGYNGHPFVKTPNLDAMSKNSMRLDRFYAAAPVCSPTRGSVLTGRHPIRINIVNHGHYIRAQEDTLAHALKRAGYMTAHFGKLHIGSVQKQSPVCPGGLGFDKWISGLNFFDIDPYLSEDGVAKQFKGESSALIVDWTIEYLKKHHKGDKPLFIVAWLPAPHDPFKSLPPESEMYLDKKGKGYFQEITTLDRHFGRLRAALRELKIEKDTLLWYCSDNGGLMKESSGGREKKTSIYEGGLRVPCLLEWPGTIKPGVNNAPTNTSDMYPTLLNLVGVKPNHNRPMDGIDIWDVIQGNKTTREQGMGFWFGFQPGQSTWSDRIIKQIMAAQKEGKEIALPERLKKNIDEFKQYPTDSFPGHAAWNKWPWKLHRIQKKDKVTFELYNLESDPMEKNNVVAKEADRVVQLKKELNDWQISVMNSLSGKDYK